MTAADPHASTEQEVLAAVDLGSNSFHMVVARLSHGQLTVIDRLREMVQLAAGLADNRLDEDSTRRALDCLSRFGERIRDMHAGRVRVVGTNTLRKARNAEVFFTRAAEHLGHPVEVISGIEEARLVYLGATHSLPSVDGPQIVLDIGGGSTEIVRGRGHQPQVMESLYLGCVSASESFFASGKLTARRFDRARLAAKLEFQPLRARFSGEPPERFVGTSGTIRAVKKLLDIRGAGDDGITPAGVKGLIKEMIRAERLENLKFEGLSERRTNVLPGGLAILIEAMGALKMDRLEVSDGALREGILHDLVGRLTDEDARVRTIRSMEGRFNVDSEQADRVEKTALAVLSQVAKAWDLIADEDRQLLVWAARLHELGLDIAHSHYHHHGAYLLEHADMPGFTKEGQRVLSRLVDGHRRSFSRKPYDELPGRWSRRALRLTVILRLAVLLHRSRADIVLPEMKFRAKGRKLTVAIPKDWLESNPLTVAGLEREQKHLDGAGLQLDLTTSEESA